MAEEQGRRAKKRKPSKDVNTLKREIADREAAAAARKAERKPSGAAARPDLQFQKKDPPAPEPEKPKYTGYNYSQHSRSRGTENQVPLRYTYRPFREEVLVDYLLDEGFASDEKSASAIVGAMSEEWKESILDEASEEDKQRLRDYDLRYYQKHGGMPPDPEKRRQLRDAARRLELRRRSEGSEGS